jgi:acyl-CoA thioester hydrolase
MEISFEHKIIVTWGDLDANNHLKNTAYLDYAGHTRFSFFKANGFSPQDFAKEGFGPIVFRDDVEYFKEARMLDEITVNVLLGGLSQDGRKFQIINEFYNDNGNKIALVTTNGAWFSHKERKLRVPPNALRNVFMNLKKSENYQDI